MAQFTDNNGRGWTVSINVDTVRRVRALTQVNLMDVFENDLFTKLALDPLLLCDVLFAAIKPDADAKGVTDADFGKALSGDALDGATRAFMEALIDFFPKARREILKKALGRMDAAMNTVLESAEKTLASESGG